MKVLIHAKNFKFDIESQADIISTELEKAGHLVEWSNQTHPARLLLNKYDVVHILTESLPLSWKNFWIAAAAKALNIPVVVSSYSTTGHQIPPAIQQMTRFQLNYFDALSVPEAGEIKNLRLFNHSKFIWPAFVRLSSPRLKTVTSNDINLIFHVTNSFDELPVTKWTLDETTYVDGSRLTANKSISELRKLWNRFIEKNRTYKNAILILNSSNLKKIMTENKSVVLINYLQLHSVELAGLIENCLELKCVLALNESQASGFPQLWTASKNGLVQNFEKSFTYQLSLTELLDKAQKIKTDNFDNSIYETKINELSRLYAKIKNQKEIKISYANLSRRP
jgi:hypothetical protein